MYLSRLLNNSLVCDFKSIILEACIVKKLAADIFIIDTKIGSSGMRE